MKLTTATRRRIYNVGIALAALAAARGVVSGEESDLWLGLLAAALGVARANVRD